MPKLGLGLSLPQTRVAGGFTPKKLSGLSLWLKADAGVTQTGGALTAWADQSGNNNNFSGSAEFIEDEINSKPAIYFDGATSYLDSPSTLLDNFSQISLFGVWFIAGGQSNKGIFGTGNYSNLEITVNPDVIVRIRNGTTGPNFIPDSFSNLGAWTISYLDAQNEGGDAYNNGYELTNADPTGIDMPLASGVTYSLGRYAYPSFPNLNAEMYLAEFIIYNRRLTTPERQQVEAYLMDKYAIAPEPSGIPISTATITVLTVGGTSAAQLGAYNKQNDTEWWGGSDYYLRYNEGNPNGWYFRNDDTGSESIHPTGTNPNFIPDTGWNDGITITAA